MKKIEDMTIPELVTELAELRLHIGEFHVDRCKSCGNEQRSKNYWPVCDKCGSMELNKRVLPEQAMVRLDGITRALDLKCEEAGIVTTSERVYFKKFRQQRGIAEVVISPTDLHDLLGYLLGK